MVISRRGEAGGAGALSLTVLNRQPTIQRWLTPVTRLGIPVAGVIAVNATPGLRPVGTCPYCRPEVGVVPGVTGSPAGGDGAAGPSRSLHRSGQLVRDRPTSAHAVPAQARS